MKLNENRKTPTVARTESNRKSIIYLSEKDTLDNT